MPDQVKLEHCDTNEKRRGRLCVCVRSSCQCYQTKRYARIRDPQSVANLSLALQTCSHEKKISVIFIVVSSWAARALGQKTVLQLQTIQPLASFKCLVLLCHALRALRQGDVSSPQSSNICCFRTPRLDVQLQ